MLYLATDDLDTVVPIATSALRPWNVTIASARNLGRDLGPTGGRLMRTLDSSAALVALDVAAVLGASAFSPAPRSGLSVHYLAMRGCERIPGYQCNPAAAGCVPFASSGCPYASRAAAMTASTTAVTAATASTTTKIPLL